MKILKRLLFISLVLLQIPFIVTEMIIRLVLSIFEWLITGEITFLETIWNFQFIDKYLTKLLY